MNSNSANQPAKSFTLEQLLDAKIIEFTCHLSTVEQVSSCKVTFMLSHRNGDWGNRWYLDGFPLTNCKFPDSSVRKFYVPNYMPLLLALNANLFPQTFPIRYLSGGDTEQHPIELYILSVENAIVKEWN